MIEKIIGIDLGTSNSAASLVIKGKPTIIPSSDGTVYGGKSVPSIVSIDEEGTVLVGEPARRQFLLNPKGIIRFVKRRMGEKIKISIFGKNYSPEQISAFILKKLKKDAEEFIGEEIKKAVITVPAYYNETQRQAVKDAGTIAELDVVRIINEPTAAALAYGLEKSEGKSVKNILVFDLGGGTLDVTIMKLESGIFEVLSTSGDTKLGGSDIDKLILSKMLEKLEKKEKVTLKSGSEAYLRLSEACEKLKIELSTSLEGEINLPYLTSREQIPIHFREKFDRAELSLLLKNFLNRCEIPLEKALKDSNLKKQEISEIILVGGPTRMPQVIDFLKEKFGKISREVDPMLCVAMGAGIQGSILGGETKGIVLLDVVPLSLGIETIGNVFSKIIDRNTTIPILKKQTYTNSEDNQTAVEIAIYQGEREFVKDNHFLGKFLLTGITPKPRGMNQIEVSFDVDANGMLNVSAKDNDSGIMSSIKVEKPKKFSEEELEKMIEDSKKYEKQDSLRKEQIMLKINLKNLKYSIDDFLEKNKEKISEEDKKKLEEKYEKCSFEIEKENYDKQVFQNFLSEYNTFYIELMKKVQPIPNQEKENKEEKNKGEEVIEASETNK